MNLNDIIHKEDSAERLAATQGIDPKYLQSAEEFNCIVNTLKRLIKPILGADDYDFNSNSYSYSIQADDAVMALYAFPIRGGGSVVNRIILTDAIPIGSEIIIYNLRQNVFIDAVEFNIIPNYRDPITNESFYKLNNYATLRIKRINNNIFILSQDFGVNNENNLLKVDEIDTSLSRQQQSIIYPTVGASLDYIGQLRTGLKPIVITDYYHEGFWDINDARSFISSFGFPQPKYDYYNEQSKKYYVWYGQEYLYGEISVGLHGGDSFGSSSAISIEDPEGFIGNFEGSAFYGNYSNDNFKFGFAGIGVYSEYYFADKQGEGTIELEDVSHFGGGLLAYSSTNIVIANLTDYSYNFCDNFTSVNGSKITIKSLHQIGNNFCVNLKGRVDILSIDSSILNSEYYGLFKTESPAIVHLPYYAENTQFGNTAVTNITTTNLNNKIIFDL